MESSDNFTGQNIIIEFITQLGCGFLKLAVGLFMFIFKIVKFPFVTIAKALRSSVRGIIRFVKSVFGDNNGNKKYFTGRISRSLKNVRSAAGTGKKNALHLLMFYMRKASKQYKNITKHAILTVLTVAVCVLSAVTLNRLSDKSLALRIDTGDVTLGYVSSESDYLEARSLAKERLNLSSGTEDSASELLPEVTYTVELIDVNAFTGARTLCERIIENSDAEIVNACGIYINGEFLCAVKNEVDAKRVFNSVLESDPNYGTDAILTFVQDIDYVEGLYRDTQQILWDSEKLATTVASEAKNGLLTVKCLKTEVTNEDVAFETVEILSDALYQGTRRTIVSGVNGVEQVTHLVTYINGEKISSEEVSRITVKEPVAKRVQVGTKALDSSYNYSVSYGGVLVWPAVNAHHINSSYGWRWGKLHAGIDIGSSSGTSTGKLIVAAASGTVVMAGYQSSYGNYIRIDHGNGFQTGYAHCLSGSLMVNVGDKVEAGQAIARIGQTGYATGPHLHFEVFVYGKRVNPAPYLGLS